MKDLVRCLREHGLSRLLWIVVLVIPLWALRIAAGYEGAAIEGAGGRLQFTGGLRLVALSGAAFLWTALIAHGLLTSHVLAKLERRRISRRDMVAITLPSTGIACCHITWQALALSLLLHYGVVTEVLGDTLRSVLMAVGLILMLQYHAGRLTSMAGAFVTQLPTAGVVKTHDLAATAPGWLDAGWPTLLAAAYVLMSAGPPLIVPPDAPTPGPLFLFVFGGLEACLLCAWLTANVLAWHRRWGGAGADEDLTRVFS
ncbi:MAG: hypothetical protein QNJ98_11795 [Planctomycetota bacterium]|nr:hypothetical protein [Planctomycetota bacterium]